MKIGCGFFGVSVICGTRSQKFVTATLFPITSVKTVGSLMLKRRWDVSYDQ